MYRGLFNPFLEGFFNFSLTSHQFAGYVNEIREESAWFNPG
jgi:hypothetical protein